MKDQFDKAVASLRRADFARGIPKMGPLNAALKALGAGKINKAQRDALLNSVTEDETAPVVVTVTKSAMNPVPVYVHGVGSFKLWQGKATTVPTEALGALEDSDVEFTVGDDT